MSKISTAYDAIRTMILAELPNHYEVANPYFIEKEADLRFDKAWALAFADANNTFREIGCKMSYERDFIISVIRKLFITKNAIDLRYQTEKDLLEDQILIVKKLEKKNDWPSSTGIAKIEFVRDSGMQFVRSERTDLIMIQTVMTLEIFEDLT